MKPIRSRIPTIKPRELYACSVILMALSHGTKAVHAQTGPFSPTNWPPTISSSAVVDYFVVDPNAVFTTPAGWSQTVSFAGGGDQAFQQATFTGMIGDQST